ncbi:hypothetical protein PS691_01212 [Pseudomonas fluorescens]|uniref:Uncharacterized protein n=1 Tax=Pseudomonas fluorescens TaxID=294 RepID=A0A5E7ASI3_PSEFL|nr:hypothetical protein PS691_01212 [Pseudomonas fluorescens]
MSIQVPDGLITNALCATRSCDGAYFLDFYRLTGLGGRSKGRSAFGFNGNNRYVLPAVTV